MARYPASLCAAALLFILFISLLVIAQADQLFGLDSALSQAHIDPEAQQDSFLSLSKPLKKRLAELGNFDTDGKIRSLLSLHFTVPVTVYLVGFNDEERRELEALLVHYVNVLQRDDRVKMIGGDSHDLAIRSKMVLQVLSKPMQLADSIFTAIEKEMLKPFPLAQSNLQPVDYISVDDIIRSDVEKSVSSYNIYLLKLRSQSRSYAYSYTKGDVSPGFSKCLGSIWTGNDRYVWIDLSAGPVQYGPAISGEGLLASGEAHPLATLHTNTKGKTFIADLASLVWSATRILFVPALRIPSVFENELEVHFLHIHGSEQEPDNKGLNWETIERVFLHDNKKSLLLAKQHLKFKRHSIKYSSCAICVAAVSHSQRFYTSRFLLENYTMFVNEYLDSKQLHFAFRQAKQELAIKAGISHSSLARVVPVYVLDLDHDRPLLLDRYHQAMAFKDMVIAVRTRSPQSVSDYSCNGRHMVTQLRELERPIVGALLQTLWGVSPTHVTWSTQHNDTVIDYTWSIGQTPFGPFSNMLSLSFAQRDSAPRNTILTLLNATISSAIEILQAVKAHGGERLLLSKRHAEFTMRWEVFKFKLTKAASAVSHFDFNISLYFLKSSDYDLSFLHRIVYETATELHPTLKCLHDPPIPWTSILIPLLLATVLFYLWIRRETVFANKTKQF